MKRSACLIHNPVAGQGDSEADLQRIRELLEPEIDLDIRLTTKEVDAMNTFELLELYAAGERDFPETKLSNARLVGENLSGINLTRSILWATNLSNTILKRANLALTSLAWSDLSGANLSGADLSGADLSGADLSGADLSGADLSGTILIQTNLTGTIMPDGITQK